jgi:thymidylate kinase
MMYIFEGVDCAGKDTLIAKIREVYKVPLFNGLNVYDTAEYKEVRPYILDYKQWQRALDFEIINFQMQTGLQVIMNRFIWSEIVYSNVFRNGADEFFTKILKPKLKKIAKIIYLDCPTEEIQERLVQGGKYKTLDVLHNIDKLKAEYEKLIMEEEIPVLRVNSSKNYKPNYMTDQNEFDTLIQKVFKKL